MSSSQPAEPLPAATVVLLRDATSPLEVLLLQRATRSGMAWVFPGGKVDPQDGESTDPDDAPLHAAVRETREEAGLEIEREELVTISRWITPELAPKRFDTWFYAARVAPDREVRVDGVEIQSHRWLSAESALNLHHQGEIRLAPPTFVTVTWLAAYDTAAAALRALAAEPLITFRPRFCPIPDGACMLYPGDAGYEDLDPDLPGARHRFWMLPERVRYERSGC